MRATVEQIAATGFAETRVADVAGALGVSTALVFYHFESKDRLLSEAFSYAAERDLERLERLKGSDTAPVLRLRKMLSFYGPEGGQGWTLWIEAWAAALRMPELQKVSRRLDVHWKNAFADVIREGVEAGDFRCLDPNGAAWRITARDRRARDPGHGAQGRRVAGNAHPLGVAGRRRGARHRRRARRLRVPRSRHTRHLIG